MSAAPRSWRPFALLGLLLAGAASAATEDLTGFRTVDTAVKADTSVASAVAPGLTGYLGVHVEPDKRGRLTVTEVAPDSPAMRAGIAADDVLDRVDARPVHTDAELRDILQAHSSGQALPLRIVRGKKRLDVRATLQTTSRPLKISERRAILGISIGDPDETGAPIRLVASGSPAAEAGVKTGDMLRRIDGAPLTLAARLGDTVAEKQPGESVHLSLLREGKELELDVRLAEDKGGVDPAVREARVWKKDVYRLAVIGVEYADVKHNPGISAHDWEESLFSKGTYTGKNNVTGQPVYGSMNDYYQELSCGVFRVEGKVFDWVQVGKNRADYASGTANRSPLLTEALDALRERDGKDALNGYDGVFFLYAGSRYATNRGGIYWPHRATVNYKGQAWPYYIMQEGGERMSSISTMCHEFGHMLGMPDLYARPENPGSEGLGIWCAMSNENPNGRPQHMGAWCKEQLGWLKPVTIDPTVKQKLILAPVEGSGRECYKVLVRPDGSEYLLLENRRRMGFDTNLPGEGLLIWRVVGRRPILEESHGVEGPAGPRVFPTIVPYPSKANDSYTPYTMPSSRSQLGGGLPVHITNIRQLEDGRITFYVGYEFE